MQLFSWSSNESDPSKELSGRSKLESGSVIGREADAEEVLPLPPRISIAGTLRQFNATLDHVSVSKRGKGKRQDLEWRMTQSIHQFWIRSMKEQSAEKGDWFLKFCCQM
jgi:hypothetical protein